MPSKASAIDDLAYAHKKHAWEGHLEEMERLVKELGCWTAKTSFMREACLKKLGKHREERRLEA